MTSNSAHRITPEMVPISGLNPLFNYISGMRQVMFTGNLPQANVIPGADRKRFRSGLEHQHAKGTVRHEFKDNATVIAVIPRFTSLEYGEQFALNPVDVVIFDNERTGQLDVIELSRFHILHQHYGFRYQFDERVYNYITPRARFKEGTVIARSPNVKDDGDYTIGIETNVCAISDPSVIEDGVAYSRSWAKKISTRGYETRQFSCGRSHYPVNINGNDEDFKAVPDIGEKIGKNGLICALRPYHPYLDAVYMSRNKMLKTINGLDTPYYGIPEATVVDIKVLHNDQFDGPKLPEEMSAQFRKYHEADKRFYLEIIRTCTMRQGRHMSETPNLSPRLWQMVYEGIVRCGEDLVKEGIWPREDVQRLRAQKNYRGEAMDEWIIEVTFEYMTNAGVGQKVSDFAGSKGVNTAVWEDEDMPIDEFGNRADIVIFSASVGSRMNIGRCHEQAFNATGRDVIKRIRRSYGLKDAGELDPRLVEDCVRGDLELSLKNFDYLLGAYRILSPDEIYPRMSDPKVIESGRWIKHLIQVIHDGADPKGLFIQNRPGSSFRADKALLEIDGSEYMPEIGRVTYRNQSTGEMVTTVDPVLIGATTHLSLEKTATDWSGVSSSKVGHFGNTARLTNADKYSRPGRETVTRRAGESEERNEAAAHGAEVIAHMNDINNNPAIHAEVCRKILTAEKPTNIDKIISREKFKFGGHRPMNYAMHQLFCSGIGITRE